MPSVQEFETPVVTRPLLTRQELRVLAAVAAGHTNRSIGRRLGITEHTVAKHTQNIFRKLGVTNRCAAVARAQQLDLFPTTHPVEQAS